MEDNTAEKLNFVRYNSIIRIDDFDDYDLIKRHTVNPTFQKIKIATEEKQTGCSHLYSSPNHFFKFGDQVCFTCTICGHKLQYEYIRRY